MRGLRIALSGAFLASAVGLFGSASYARCVLPFQDGGDEPQSPANIEGDIVSIESDIVVIRALGTTSEVPVRVPRNKPIHSDFGDDDPSELRVGQRAGVWFVDCRRGTQSVPEAAYFLIFSKDPNDRP
jgi:hypothetical protein